MKNENSEESKDLLWNMKTIADPGRILMLLREKGIYGRVSLSEEKGKVQMAKYIKLHLKEADIKKFHLLNLNQQITQRKFNV